VTAPAGDPFGYTSDPAPTRDQRDRLALGGLGGAVLWVVAWLVVQLHTALGWALPLLPGFR